MFNGNSGIFARRSGTSVGEARSRVEANLCTDCDGDIVLLRSIGAKWDDVSA